MATLQPGALAALAEIALKASIRPPLVRERIMERIGERLKQISRARGYSADYGRTCDYGDLIGYEPVVIPSMRYSDGEETAQRGSYDAVEKTLVVIVETFDKLNDDEAVLASSGETMQRLAVRAATDVEHAIARDPNTRAKDDTLGGLATHISYTGARSIIGPREAPWWGALIEFSIEYATRNGDPYRLALTQEEED